MSESRFKIVPKKQIKKPIKKATTPPPIPDEFVDAMAVGHRPAASLKPQDEGLFKAFQSNLLSLISHELRTPLMGILNGLSMLEQPDAGPERGEFVEMARRNAERLQRTLAALLDLAEIESGIFHARLSEVDLSRLVKACINEMTPRLKGKALRLDVRSDEGELLALVDPQKFARAVDLCMQSAVQRSVRGGVLQVRISSTRVIFHFLMEPDKNTYWENAWTEALAGFRGGVLSPGSAFAGTMQSEEQFLTRMEEGLGSEFLLIHEIMRLHHGGFTSGLEGELTRISLELPALSDEETLRIVLSSRSARFAFDRGALETLTLALVRVPEGEETAVFHAFVRQKLFRATDAAYALPDKRLIALVLDDCKPADAPRLLGRLANGLGLVPAFGVSFIPADGTDPAKLIELTQRRLAEIESSGGGR